MHKTKQKKYWFANPSEPGGQPNSNLALGDFLPRTVFRHLIVIILFLTRTVTFTVVISTKIADIHNCWFKKTRQ